MSFFGKKSEQKPEPRALELAPAPPAPARYGIEDAIHLMRKLPLDKDLDLILLVIRNTLGSMNVDVKDVIQDGAAKQERLCANLASLEAAIRELEKEIAIRKQEMAAVEADLAETTTVRERLELAAGRESTIMHPLVAPPAKVNSSPPKPPPRPPGSPPLAKTAPEEALLEVEPMPDSIQVPALGTSPKH